MNGVPARLSAARTTAGLTQRQVAKELDVTIGSVQAWEYGNAGLSFARACELTKLYGITLDWLAYGGDAPDDHPLLKQIRNLLT